MAVTFGMAIRDAGLRNLGIRNCAISLLISIFVGFIIGLVLFTWSREWHPPPDGVWPTSVMTQVGHLRMLWIGVLLGIPAGGSLGITLLNDRLAANVGAALALAFLPPLINAGLFWAYSTHCIMKGIGEDEISYTFDGQT